MNKYIFAIGLTITLLIMLSFYINLNRSMPSYKIQYKEIAERYRIMSKVPLLPIYIVRHSIYQPFYYGDLSYEPHKCKYINDYEIAKRLLKETIQSDKEMEASWEDVKK